jgi:hypothetical protein
MPRLVCPQSLAATRLIRAGGAPPLVITSDQVDWALEQFAAILTQDFS